MCGTTRSSGSGQFGHWSMELADPRHERLVEWLASTDDMRKQVGWPTTQTGIADELGVAPRTIRDWMARDDVRRAWNDRAQDVIGDPSKVQEVLEQLRRVALDPEHRQYAQSVKTYLEAVKAIQPPEQKTEVKLSMSEIANFTDEELDAKIAAQLAEMEAVKAAHQILGV